MGTLDKVCSMWSFQTGGKSKTTEKVVREDMQRVCVKTEDASDRVSWRHDQLWRPQKEAAERERFVNLSVIYNL